MESESQPSRNRKSKMNDSENSDRLEKEKELAAAFADVLSRVKEIERKMVDRRSDFETEAMF